MLLDWRLWEGGEEREEGEREEGERGEENWLVKVVERRVYGTD